MQCLQQSNRLLHRPVAAAASSSLSVWSRRSYRSDLLGSDYWRWQKKDALAEMRAMEYAAPKPETVKVAVTGASGNIAYALLFRLASGEIFGKDQRVMIRCFDLDFMYDKTKGVCMEIMDCAFPTCQGIVATTELDRAFDDIDVALLVGSKPRGPGMERADLLKDNGAIFQVQGKALNRYARKEVKVTVVGNPANTNCLILANNAPDIPMENFSAMTRLDHDRGLAQLAKKANCRVTDIEQFAIWGNHSASLFADVSNCTIKGVKAVDALKAANPNEDIEKWIKTEFLTTVQKRGAAIIEARGLSSAASAANACAANARDWELGANGWKSMAVASNGEYGITPGLFYSYPVTLAGDASYEIVQGLPKFDAWSEEQVKKNEKELLEERDTVSQLLPN